MKRFRRLVATLAMAMTGVSAQAQLPGYRPIDAPPQPAGQIALPMPADAGAPSTESWLEQNGVRFVQNVTRPTLTPVLPDPAKRNGTAVIIAPGGAFMVLAMYNEGYDAAHWLAAHGVTVFVLKYRLLPTPRGVAAGDYMMDVFRGAPASPRFVATMGKGIDLAVADSQSAIRTVRARAGDWGIDPHRVGLIGFSAGAVAALNLVSRNAANTRPDFVVSLYGSMTRLPLPEKVPPLFAAMAVDDPLFGGSDYGLLDAWRKAGGTTEFHLFDRGGHGSAIPASPARRRCTGPMSSAGGSKSMAGWRPPQHPTRPRSRGGFLENHHCSLPVRAGSGRTCANQCRVFCGCGDGAVRRRHADRDDRSRSGRPHGAGSRYPRFADSSVVRGVQDAQPPPASADVGRRTDRRPGDKSGSRPQSIAA